VTLHIYAVSIDYKTITHIYEQALLLYSCIGHGLTRAGRMQAASWDADNVSCRCIWSPPCTPGTRSTGPSITSSRLPGPVVLRFRDKLIYSGAIRLQRMTCTRRGLMVSVKTESTTTGNKFRRCRFRREFVQILTAPRRATLRIMRCMC